MWYGEPLSDARTPLADFFRILLTLAGGWVYSALVEPRATTDIDLLILLDPPSREQIQALVSSLFDSTIIHPNPMALQGISIWRIVGIRSGQEVVIDFLLADSAYLRTALERRHTVPFGALQVPMLSIEDLVILKMVAGRLQDRADLEKIRTRQTDLRVDWTYVDRWKTMLGLAER
ncbi:MAG TPA: nucleotidyltransferase [Nitrospira sp.]|nr:nucleotidyltransferase [Nitrospira sp.]HRB15675.1 nucleotidyltransferase [Nitrospira sp.]